MKKEVIRIRVFLAAVPLIAANSFWLMANWGTTGYASGQSFATSTSLYYNVIFTLALLVGLNFVLCRAAPGLAFNRVEMLVLYVMLAVACSMAGHDTAQILWPMLTYPTWFATPENGWGQFQSYIPGWLTVENRGGLKDFYVGGSSLYSLDHLMLLWRPVLAWSAVWIVLALVMLCLVVIVRERWTNHEKLTYPVVEIPLAMTQSEGMLFANKLMWLGFALAAGIDLANGMHFLYPRIPGLGGSRYDIGQVFTTKPLSAIGYVPVAVYPFAIGMSFLIPADLSFSIWFFYILGKLILVAGDILGRSNAPGFPYAAEQSAGVWIVLAAAALWGGRKHFAAQLRRALHAGKRAPDEPMSPRGAVLGLAIGLALLVCFARSFGASTWLVLVYLAIFFLLAVAVTRVRAEVGPPSNDVFFDPLTTIVTFAGSARVGMPGLALFTMLQSLNRAYRCHPMPHMLEGFAMSARKNMSANPTSPVWPSGSGVWA